MAKPVEAYALLEEDVVSGSGDAKASRLRAGQSEASASLLSRVLFLWVDGLLSLGRSRQLNLEDLPELPPGCEVETLAARFEQALLDESSRPTAPASLLRRRLEMPAAFWALVATFGRSFFNAGLFKLGSDSLQFLPSLCLADYLLALGAKRTHILGRMGSTDDQGCAAAYALLLFFLPVAKTLVEQAYFYRVQLINGGVKAALQTAVYKKTVRLSSAANAGSSGERINLIQLDATRISELVTYLHVTWSALVQTLGYIALLYSFIGWSVLGGLVAMFALVPVQNRFFRVISARRKAQMALSDKRVKMENEVATGIKIIKLNGWEKPMLAAITAVRNEELGVARNLAYINAFVSCLITTLPTIVAVSAFTLYSAAMGKTMSAEVVFPSLSLFNQLRFPLMFLPRVLSMCADATVSLKRLQRYFSLPEAQSAPPRVTFVDGCISLPPPALVDEMASIQGGSFHFEAPGPGVEPFLRDVNLQLRRGQLTVVVGAVGSGKSTLAAAFLGELALCGPASGAPHVAGRVAYVAQTAWVQSLTLRDNILFGLPFCADKYAAAIEAACLGPDVALLPAGHDTEIGERGITLSGGQRARVAIARAVYADADLYILDDIMSALDAHVGRAVFSKCVRRALRGKAVLLITHHLALAAEADCVCVMAGGQIVESGSFPALMARPGGQLEALMAAHGGEAEEEAKEEAAPMAPAAPAVAAATKAGVEDGKLISAEKREEGTVKFAVYGSYAKSFPGGWPTVGGLLALNVLKQLISIAATLWLAVWSGRKLKGWDDAGYLGAYAGISIAVALVTYAKALAFTYCGIKAASLLHQKLLSAVLGTRQSFFDVTPLGRILQRFTKDTDVVDNTLPANWNSTSEFFTGLVSVLLAICIIEPTVIPLFIPLFALYFRVQAFFRASYREIKRLDGTTGSPIFSHFSESLAGLATLRAFGHQERFCLENARHVAANQRAFYAQRCACDRWLPVRLETVGNSIVLSVALLGVPYADTGYAPFVGLVLSFALDLTGLLSWVVRQWSETEAGMVSIERIAEYADLPSEEETAGKDGGPGSGTLAPASWPSAGSLRFDALSLRYQPSAPLVLRAVSAEIRGGEKIGVVGRTGSGKSTLLVALWRLVEAESGTVWLDGVDIRTLALSELRQRITCIPQDPILFSGSIRHNLNPIGAAAGAHAISDSVLWDVLEAAGMKTAVSALGQGLEAEVAEFGASFSAGERQLMSLARALLRDTRVICLDEATASVDLASDARMQSVITDRFRACTVITIAHRLHTIIGADRIMAMDGGNLAALDSPASLLADRGSIFSRLVEESGEASLLRAKAGMGSSADLFSQAN